MNKEVLDFIVNYGYLAVFAVVFSQEVGIPNPIPNELVLMSTGYLCFKGILLLPLVIMAAVCGDFIGTGILYTVFYFFGVFILKHKPRWIPISELSIAKLSRKISKEGKLRIYLFRLTPFIRGYTSIIAGLLNMKPRVFLPIAGLSAITWAALYVITGRLLGPYWSYVGNKMGRVKYIILLAVVIVLVIVAIVRFMKDRREAAAAAAGLK
jgi:membrane protein DedA with SNARE-associated domain